MSRTPHRAGQAVMRTRDGQIGIITEPPRKSGPNKGKLAVIFVDYDWEISVEPDEVEVIDIVRATPVAEPTNGGGKYAPGGELWPSDRDPISGRYIPQPPLQ